MSAGGFLHGTSDQKSQSVAVPPFKRYEVTQRRTSPGRDNKNFQSRGLETGHFTLTEPKSSSAPQAERPDLRDSHTTGEDLTGSTLDLVCRHRHLGTTRHKARTRPTSIQIRTDQRRISNASGKFQKPRRTHRTLSRQRALHTLQQVEAISFQGIPGSASSAYRPIGLCSTRASTPPSCRGLKLPTPSTPTSPAFGSCRPGHDL